MRYPLQFNKRAQLTELIVGLHNKLGRTDSLLFGTRQATEFHHYFQH
jgi:hypothetical protein